MTMNIHEIDTPSLVVDLDIMETNIQTYQAYFDEHEIGFRPHIKTHKIPALAHRQLAAGAIGITCQKLDEVAVMVHAGIENILLYYNIVGQPKLDRLCRLSRQCQLTTTVDSQFVAAGMAHAASRHQMALSVLAELGSFNHRTGVRTVAELVQLAQFIDHNPHLRLAGLATYPSGLENCELIAEAVDAFQAHGLSTEIVSGGGSPTAWEAHQVPGLTEHRAGTYIFHDKMCIDKGFAQVPTCALRVVTTLVSNPVPERGIIDGGTKTFSADGALPRGLVVNFPDTEIYRTNEEHGYLDLSRCTDPPVIGARLWVIPNHVCVTVNLHERVYGVRGDTVEEEWVIAARGVH